MNLIFCFIRKNRPAHHQYQLMTVMRTMMSKPSGYVTDFQIKMINNVFYHQVFISMCNLTSMQIFENGIQRLSFRVECYAINLQKSRGENLIIVALKVKLVF